MCEALDSWVKEERMEIAKNFFESGASFELVKTSIKSLSEEELKKIYDEVMGNK